MSLGGSSIAPVAKDGLVATKLCGQNGQSANVIKEDEYLSTSFDASASAKACTFIKCSFLPALLT